MLYGDVNSDSKIDILDMILLKSYVNDKNTDGFSVKSADVDGDGKISAKDVVELSMYLMNQTQSFSYEASIDTDGDGLSDYVEKELIKTDYLKKDTDNDGLDDYVEVYLCNTDPLNDCKDGSDIKDCDIDSDNDGLKNGDEVNKYGTSPGLTDTDSDGISDYDEVFGKIKSDPLKKDSDDDGISDFGELQLSLDPMKKSSDGKTLDNNRYFEQKLPDEKLLAINTDDNFYKLSVSANLKGYAPESLTVCESSYASMLDEYAVNGMVIDVKYLDEYKDDTGNFNLNLNFELKNCNNPEDYMIFKYVEEFYVLLPVETEWSGNSLILNDIDDGTYCVVDLTAIEFEDSEITDTATASNTVNTPVLNDMVSDTGLLIDSVNATSKNVSYTCIFNLGSGFKVDFWNAGVGDAVENSVKRLVDNGYTATVTMIFKGKYSASGSYTVKTICKSLQEVSDLCNEASSFFDKSITSSNAGSEYNAVNKSLGNRLTLSLSSLNYSNYTSSSNPVFVFNDSVSGAVCKFKSGGATCSVLGKNNTLFNPIGADGSQKIYDIVTAGEGKTSYNVSLFGKAYIKTILTANMVSSYNSKTLTPAQRKTLGFMDTDGDGIDDALEIAMNLLKVSGNKVVYPTFGAAANTSVLTKGLEILSKKKNVSVQNVKNTTYLPQKLLLNNPDTDGDGYDDIEDPEPNKKPEYLDCYDFLDQEIYYINFMYADKYMEKSATDAYIEKKADNDYQKFKFEWSGRGYKIYSLSDPAAILTVSDISSDNGKITFEADKNDDSQLWEVLPYWTDDYPYGLVIRSKVMVDDSGVGKSLYLSYDNGKIIATTNRDPFCRINLADIADWVRFGKIYADSQSWINLTVEDTIYINPKNIEQSLENYYVNGYIGLDASNKFNDSGIGKDLLVLQSQGNFPLLTYANSSMDKVICEVIATHNAMILADIQRNDDNFFRLASEFEVNARIPTNKSIMMYIDYLSSPTVYTLNLIFDDKIELDLSNYWNKGGLGSNPLKIGDCLKAYDLEYDIYTTYNDFQNNLNKCRGGIISFSFDLIRIHTYAIRYNPTESTGKYYRGYNRSNSQVLWDDPSVEENIRTDNNILVGYTIK